MSTERLDVDADLLAQVRELVGPAGLVEFVERALRHELRRGKLGQLLAELEAEVGPVPEDLQAEAEAFWRAG